MIIINVVSIKSSKELLMGLDMYLYKVRCRNKEEVL